MMNTKEVEQKIIDIIHNVTDIPKDEIQPDSAMMDELDISSLEIMMMIAEVEKTFKLRIPEKDLRKFVSVSDIAEYVVGKLN